MGKIKGTRADLKADLKVELGAVEAAIEEVSKTLEPLKEKVEMLESKQELTDLNLLKLKKDLLAEITKMKIKNEKNEQYGRRKNLIINGDPLPRDKNTKEDIYNIVMKITPTCW